MSEVLKRALSVQRAAIGYELGAGGREPRLAHPGGRSKKGHPGLWCDCSGFVSWCMGLDRYQKPAWLNTDSLILDAKRHHRWVREVLDVQEGDLVIWPSTFKDGVRVRIGHTGIVSKVPRITALLTDMFSEKWWALLRVIHCSSSNYKRGWILKRDGAAAGGATPEEAIAHANLTASAIQETSGRMFGQHASIFARKV